MTVSMATPNKTNVLLLLSQTRETTCWVQLHWALRTPVWAQLEVCSVTQPLNDAISNWGGGKRLYPYLFPALSNRLLKFKAFSYVEEGRPQKASRASRSIQSVQNVKYFDVTSDGGWMLFGYNQKASTVAHK